MGPGTSYTSSERPHARVPNIDTIRFYHGHYQLVNPPLLAAGYRVRQRN
jgi:hypothetical protein